ncbi:MAG: hypothetical protein QOH46_1344, partial [Solirubrobacteraceae bacterium]|nr:hypothetical protein [Solirubrobacteraceae bacterium]
LEGATQLGLMGGANDVVALMFECGIEEEAVVIQLEVLALFADSGLAQREELFALGERTDGNRPFLESNWHREGVSEGGLTKMIPGAGDDVA